MEESFRNFNLLSPYNLNKNMISFRSIGYMGRLGNQMFQFSSALGIAEKRGFDVIFPESNCYRVSLNGPIDPKTGLNVILGTVLTSLWDISFLTGKSILLQCIGREI